MTTNMEPQNTRPLPPSPDTSARSLAEQFTAAGIPCTPDEVLLAAGLSNLVGQVLARHPHLDCPAVQAIFVSSDPKSHACALLLARHCFKAASQVAARDAEIAELRALAGLPEKTDVPSLREVATEIGIDLANQLVAVLNGMPLEPKKPKKPKKLRHLRG